MVLLHVWDYSAFTAAFLHRCKVQGVVSTNERTFLLLRCLGGLCIPPTSHKTHTHQPSSCQSTAIHDVYKTHSANHRLHRGLLHMSNIAPHSHLITIRLSPFFKLLAFDMLKSRVAEKCDRTVEMLDFFSSLEVLFLCSVQLALQEGSACWANMRF